MDTRGTRLNRIKLLVGLGLALVGAWFTIALAQAHGTTIELTTEADRVAIHALYENGEPMSLAQIIVYAADNPREAWLTGEADEEGRYSFAVDTGISGSWAISIRTAGHGELLHFDVSRNGRITVDQATERTPLQTGLMAGGVIAVLGGVAWFFSRPRQKAATSVS